MRASTELLRQAGHTVRWYGGRVVGALPEVDGLSEIAELDTLSLLSSPTRVYTVRQKLLKALREFQPDIVHLVDQFDSRIQRALCKEFPVVISAHLVALTCPASTRLVPPSGQCTKNSGLQCLVHHVSQGCLSHFTSTRGRSVAVVNYKLRRASLKNCRAVLAVSHYVAEQLLRDGWDPAKVRTVYNPVAIPDETPLPNSKTLHMACVTRLEPYKGVQNLLEALAILPHLDWQLSIAGTGSYTQSLKRMVSELNLGERVTFLGRLSFPEVSQLLNRSHVLVQSNSGPEPFGLSVAEAMAAGRAVLVSNVAALNEIVKDKKTGLVVAAGEKSALANALQQLILDRPLVESLGKAARASIQMRFSGELHLEATLDAYQSVLSSGLGLSRLKTEAI